VVDKSIGKSLDEEEDLDGAFSAFLGSQEKVLAAPGVQNLRTFGKGRKGHSLDVLDHAVKYTRV
jgi:hypothetical protein